jgi:SpoVK/Ycf46/Vps4 family AAA+-type ATPase
MIKSLLRDITSDLRSDELDKISALTDGWTGSDLKGLAVEAAMAPLRDALSGGKRTRKRVYSILPNDDTGGDGDNGDDQVDERTGRKRVRDYDDNDDEEDDDDDDGEWLPQSWAQHPSQPLMSIRAVTAIDFENALTICFPSARHHQQQQQQQHDQQQHFFFNPPHDDPDISNSSSSSSDLVWTTDDTSLSTSDPVFLEGQEGEGKEGEGEITTTPSYV